MLEQYFTFIHSTIAQHGYGIVFVGLILESIVIVGLFFPGIFILIFAGYLAGAGELSLFGVLFAAIAGVFVGDMISYLLGRYALVKVDVLKKYVSGLNDIESKISGKKQTLFLLFFHFPVYARMIVPLIVGSMRYNWKKRIVLESIGISIFVSTFVMVGYVLGQAARELEQALSIGSTLQRVFFIGFGCLLFFIIQDVRKMLKNKDQFSEKTDLGK